MILFATAFIYGLSWEEALWHNREPRKSELAVLRAIKTRDIDHLGPFLGKPVQLRNIYNVRQDYRNILKSKFSDAQLEKTYAFVVGTGTLTKSTPKPLARKLLNEFARCMESDSTGNFGQGYDNRPGDLEFGNYFPHHYSSPYQFDREGLIAKIASGSYYSFALGRRPSGSPVLLRCQIVDHVKGIDFDWFNTFTSAFMGSDE